MTKKKATEGQNIKDRVISKNMKQFIEELKVEVEKIGMKSYFDENNHSLQTWPSMEDDRAPIQIVISKNLAYISIYTTNVNFKSLNPYILDIIDTLCNEYGYAVSSSGIHSGASEYGLALGSIWAILEKEK